MHNNKSCVNRNTLRVLSTWKNWTRLKLKGIQSLVGNLINANLCHWPLVSLFFIGERQEWILLQLRPAVQSCKVSQIVSSADWRLRTSFDTTLHFGFPTSRRFLNTFSAAVPKGVITIRWVVLGRQGGLGNLRSCSWACPGTSATSMPHLTVSLYICSSRGNARGMV